MDESTYVRDLFDTSFIKQYKYTSRELFNKYIRLNIRRKLDKFSNIVNKTKIFSYTNDLTETEKFIVNALEKNYKRTILIRHNDLSIEEMESLVDDLIYEKIMIESIDSIILLEDLDYLNDYNNSFKILKTAYLYILEVEIYKYFDIMNYIWKNNKNKVFIDNKIRCLSIEIQHEKEKIISQIAKKQCNNDFYLYRKFVGLLSTLPIKDIYNKYEDSVISDVYKTKYLITIRNKFELSLDNRKQKKILLTDRKKHKSFAQEILTKYNKKIEEDNKLISMLKDENNLNAKKVSNYEEAIRNYNNMSFFKKIKKLFSKDDITLLNRMQ